MHIPNLDTGNAVTFVNSNGVSWGTNGDQITASVAGASAGVQALSAGTTQATSGTIVFSNSNGVSFGVNGQTVTASVAGGGGMAISADGSSVSSGTVVFADANNVTFGMNGSTVTASAEAFSFAIAGPGGATITDQAIFLSSNNVTLGYLGGGVITASAAVALSAGTQSAFVSSIEFDNSNGVSFGLNAGTITASAAPDVSHWQNFACGPLLLGNTTNLFFFAPLEPTMRAFPGNMTNVGTFQAGLAAVSTVASVGTAYFSFGFYTLNNPLGVPTLSLANSLSISISYTSGGGTLTQGIPLGWQWIGQASNAWSSQPSFSMGSYWLGVFATFSSNQQSFSWIGSPIANATAWQGTMQNQPIVNNGFNVMPGFGYWQGAGSTVTSALPSSAAISDVHFGAASLSTGGFIPAIVFNNTFGSY